MLTKSQQIKVDKIAITLEDLISDREEKLDRLNEIEEPAQATENKIESLESTIEYLTEALDSLREIELPNL